jgi:hypothetical protein
MTRCDRMKCKSPASAVVISENNFLDLVSRDIQNIHMRPGQIVEIETKPIILQAFCDFCMFVMNIKFATPDSRWPEGAEL